MKRPFRGDANKDGYLTKEEAVDFIKGGTKTSTKTSGKTADRKISAPKPRSNNSGGARKLSGKATAAELTKMLAGKRESLSDIDANADGQIQMSEFSSDWNEETLQSFRTTDTNGDGILSADEWAKRTN